ncbi:MAG: hypothetical protein QM296_02795, partial [Bacillota bacterium]|nr:hypothetical protein [Bacillota bacterium]
MDCTADFLSFVLASGNIEEFVQREKLRWCSETGAGTKKLARGGQKLRWCPQIGAGTKKLSKGEQKMRW